MNLYLIRHGLSVGNLNITHQTESTPLSGIGLKQAKAVAKRFKNLPVDLILSSKMERAKQTAEAIAKSTGLEIEHTDLLMEQRGPSELGELSESHPKAKKIMDTLHARIHDLDFHFSDEENFQDLKERAREFLIYVVSLNKEDIVAVTHGLTLRMIVGLILLGEDFSSKEFAKFHHSFKTTNTGITLCTFERTQKKWQLLTWNDHSHWTE